MFYFRSKLPIAKCFRNELTDSVANNPFKLPFFTLDCIPSSLFNLCSAGLLITSTELTHILTMRIMPLSLQLAKIFIHFNALHRGFKVSVPNPEVK